MFMTRLLSGIVLLIIAILSFFIGGPLLTLILLAVSLIGYRELTRALGGVEQGNRLTVPEILGGVGIVVYYGFILLAERNILVGNVITYLFACIVFFVLAELFVYVITFPRYHAEQIVSAVFAFLYAPVMLSFIGLTRMSRNGIYTVWLILISSWGCDTCAYAVGKLIGKKKIFPQLSPKKSLEGCIGGVAGAALIGVIYSWFVTGRTAEVIAGFALVCAVGAVMSMVGDLAASAIKRNKGIKDYGRLIPGHGGIMDRFDSVIVTAPMVYFLSQLLLTMGVI